MIPLLGRTLVLGALVFAGSGVVTGAWAGRWHDRRALEWTRWAAYGFSACMLAANLLMIYALVTLDFSVHYVAEVGSQATPLHIRVVSLWASLNGSILFWGGVLGLYVAGVTAALGRRYDAYLPWTLHVLLAISVFFGMLVAGIANPFEAVPNPPTDGPGPNPLLQNHWLMIIHPPTLYLGYVGMSVPFSMLCAALLAGRLEAGWMAPVRQWMLIPWTFLTVGILLGGWWSYAVLGWGGAWAWDPVENASFHPWLTGTAFLHSAMVLQRRDQLRDWTLALGMSTFLLTLVGTFMTRSGVFNSVHSFTQSDIGPVFLGFIAVVLTGSVLLLAVRTPALDESGERQQALLGTRHLAGGLGAFWSRESMILAQNALFTVFTFVVLLGTLYPLITEATQGRQVSVGEPYFDRWALPLGLGLVFLMGVGPALPWGRQPPERAMRRLLPPLIGGVALALPFAAVGYTGPLSLLALFVCGFALLANLGEFWTPLQVRLGRKEPVVGAAARTFLRTRRRFGGHIAHYGVVLAVFSLALAKGYKLEEDFALNAGQSAEFAGFTLTFQGSKEVQEAHRRSRVTDFQVDGAEVLSPRMNFYPTQREPIVTPAVRSRPVGDLYLSLLEVGADGRSVVVRAMYHPFQVWLWVSLVVIGLGSLLAFWPEPRPKTQALPQGAVVQ